MRAERGCHGQNGRRKKELKFHDGPVEKKVSQKKRQPERMLFVLSGVSLRH
jgi:hypothetical protein